MTGRLRLSWEWSTMNLRQSSPTARGVDSCNKRQLAVFAPDVHTRTLAGVSLIHRSHKDIGFCLPDPPVTNNRCAESSCRAPRVPLSHPQGFIRSGPYVSLILDPEPVTHWCALGDFLNFLGLRFFLSVLPVVSQRPSKSKFIKMEVSLAFSWELLIGHTAKVTFCVFSVPIFF